MKTIPQQDSAERAFNKLARTFAAQVEALKRHRSVGEQTMRVGQVTVSEAGRLSSAMSQLGAGAVPEKQNHPHETGVLVPESSAIFGDFETNEKAVQGSCGPGLDRLPLPRGWRRSAKGKANGSYKHGLHTQQARAERRLISDFLRLPGSWRYQIGTTVVDSTVCAGRHKRDIRLRGYEAHEKN